MMKQMLHERFRRFAVRSSDVIGSPLVFLFACALLFIWLDAYWRSGWSESLNLLGNIFISVFTFLVCLLNLNTQMRDTRALQLKLDELIRANDGARNVLIHAEAKEETTLRRIAEELHNDVD